jgi:hypothetical protein
VPTVFDVGFEPMSRFVVSSTLIHVCVHSVLNPDAAGSMVARRIRRRLVWVLQSGVQELTNPPQSGGPSFSDREQNIPMFRGRPDWRPLSFRPVFLLQVGLFQPVPWAGEIWPLVS